MEAEKSNENLVNTAFAGFGILVYVVTNVLMEIAAGTFGSFARIRGIPAVQHGVPVAAGILVFAILFTNKKTQTWADECISEVRKVVWPSKKDTWAMTIVCCVMVVFAGIGFGIFDFAASQLIKIFVN